MSGYDIEIKRVRIIDLPAITRMAYANMTGVDPQFTQLVSNPIGRFFGYLLFPFYFGLTGDGYKAVSEGKIVGCAYLYLNKSSGYVFNVNVNKANRRQGVARKLMHHLETITKNRQRSLLVLQVEDENYPAKRLYEALGFRSYHPNYLRMDISMGIRQAVESAVSLESLNRYRGRGLYNRYKTLERREGDRWALRALEDYHERQGGGDGRYWRCLLNGEEAGALWQSRTDSSSVITLALKPKYWGHVGQTGLVKQVVDQVTFDRPFLDLYFGSSSHHKSAVSIFTQLGFREMIQPRLLMVKVLE